MSSIGLFIGIIVRQAALAEELAVLKQVDQISSDGQSPPRVTNGYPRFITMKLCPPPPNSCHGWLLYICINVCIILYYNQYIWYL